MPAHRYHFLFLYAFTLTFATLHTPHPATAGRSYQKIQKAICSGFFFHAARKDAQDGYKTGGWDAARLDGMEHCCYALWLTGENTIALSA